MKELADRIAEQALLVDSIETEELSIDQLFNPESIARPQYAEACLAGAYLTLGALDQSHDISQNLPDAAGSYWHAIMHRMEGDYSNSCYWLRQAALSAPFTELPGKLKSEIPRPAHKSIAKLIEAENWEPAQFVAAVETVSTTNKEAIKQLQTIQTAEWVALYNYCCKKALS